MTRRTAGLLGAALLLAGCATLQDLPGLLGEAARGEVVEAATFSRAADGAAPARYWLPYIVLPSKPRTQYRLASVDGEVALEALAEQSASGLYRAMRIDPRRHRVLEWRWKVEALIPEADNRIAQREDSPARVIVAFRGDFERLDFLERGRLRLARALSGQELPYATLMYIWSNHHPPETVIHNPHTSRIRMIVVESGGERAGEWVSYRRDLEADYRRAFEEDPADVVAVGLMTDTDNTRTTARAWYGDISFRTPRATAP